MEYFNCLEEEKNTKQKITNQEWEVKKKNNILNKQMKMYVDEKKNEKKIEKKSWLKWLTCC